MKMPAKISPGGLGAKAHQFIAFISPKLNTMSLVAVVAWIASYFLQLVLLPIIIVGQNVQSEASDARAAKTFDDTEYIKNQVNENTDGGVKLILDRLDTIHDRLDK